MSNNISVSNTYMTKEEASEHSTINSDEKWDGSALCDITKSLCKIDTGTIIVLQSHRDRKRLPMEGSSLYDIMDSKNSQKILMQ
eukprot:7369278-Ditylum_brightwellii.AAC.1